MTLPIAALAVGIALCIGWLVGYAAGKAMRRPVVQRVVRHEPEVAYVTRLNSRNLTQEFRP